MRSKLPEPSRANLNYQPEVAMARGVLVDDENLLALIPFLEMQRFRVLSLEPGMKDDRIVNPTMKDDEIASLLSHRIFVTNSAEDFRLAAAVHEFSIIDTAGYLQDPPSLAQEIFQCWMQLKLKGKQPFILRLMREGGPVLEQVE